MCACTAMCTHNACVEVEDNSQESVLTSLPEIQGPNSGYEPCILQVPLLDKPSSEPNFFFAFCFVFVVIVFIMIEHLTDHFKCKASVQIHLVREL